MYVTAHRVRNSSGMEGVNAFYYVHGPSLPSDLGSIPDGDPGTLCTQSLAISPPGNRVRSFLDIVAPDGEGWPEVRHAFMSFVSGQHLAPFPWSARVGCCYLRTGMDTQAARAWRHEIALLFRAAQVVRLQA